MIPLRSAQGQPAALLRLSRLAALDAGDIAALAAAVRSAQTVRARRELVFEGQEIAAPKLIVGGWAARARVLPDGRRQLLSFLLPGDLFGHCSHARPLAVSSIVAITDVSFCTAPPAASPALAETYAVSSALEEAYLLAHIARLGRMSAQERFSDLLLELHERLALAGLVDGDEFDLPLTQEALADALGLTSVHVNRTVQAMRRLGEFRWSRGRVALGDRAALAMSLGRSPTRVSAASIG